MGERTTGGHTTAGTRKYDRSRAMLIRPRRGGQLSWDAERMRYLATIFCLGLTLSCSDASDVGHDGAAGSPNTTDTYGDARIRCVDRTNALRATKGLKPIPRLASAEPCVDGQAKSDSESGKPHGAFDACLNQVEWRGAAQNECPGYASVESTLGACLDMMWAEGPGGGHYDNMVGNSTHTACGFYTTPAGKVWMIQDFWTE
jgi:hypothetical protein